MKDEKSPKRRRGSERVTTEQMKNHSFAVPHVKEAPSAVEARGPRPSARSRARNRRLVWTCAWGETIPVAVAVAGPRQPRQRPPTTTLRISAPWLARTAAERYVTGESTIVCSSR